MLILSRLAGSAVPDPAIMRDGLQVQVPPAREMMLSPAVLEIKKRESTTALRARYKGLSVPRLTLNLNDLRVTWVRGVTSNSYDTKAMDPSKPHTVDVNYSSNKIPTNEDRFDWSLGNSACVSGPEPLLSRERFCNPRTLSYNSMSGAWATDEVIITCLL